MINYVVKLGEPTRVTPQAEQPADVASLFNCDLPAQRRRKEIENQQKVQRSRKKKPFSPWQC